MTEQEKQSRMQALAKELEPSNWNNLNLQKRTELLQCVENFQAELQNRPAATVSTELMETNIRGKYSNTNQEIVQNHDMVKYCETSDMALKNLLHEGRHAFQYDAVAHPGNHPEISEETRTEWGRNLASEGYIHPKDDTFQYYWQPVEVDARAYAETQSLEYSKALAQNQNISEDLSVCQASAESQSLSTGENNTYTTVQSAEEGIVSATSEGTTESSCEGNGQSDDGYSQSID